jgi:hypothetical protein
MNAKLEHVRAVYAKLVEDGFDASMKYPGYIACGQKTRRGPSPPEQSRFLFLINVSVSAAFN